MVRLLEIAPELGAVLPADEHALVSRLAVPLTTLSDEAVNVDAALGEAGAFAAVIVDGILLHRMAVGAQPALRMLGHGDMVNRSGGMRTTLLSESTYRAAGPVRLAMLDERVLLTARRFPGLFIALQTRLGEQHQRLAAQLAICQLPRVEDRLLALMWLLAETWGRVTARGTVVPLSLTHGALGELIGARRSTITLALKELSEQGALIRQDREWLLLAPPPAAAGPSPATADPEVVAVQPGGWSAPQPPVPAQRRFDELHGIISMLRESQARSAGEVRTRLDRARRTRERSESLRRQIAGHRVSRRGRAPSRRPAP